MSEDGRALVAYLQRLGTGIGDWRESFASTRLAAGAALNLDLHDQVEMRALGRAVYERRCVGCHGVRGDGNGPMASFLDPKPRDFTRGIFKFRSTRGKDSLPSDADLFVTISRGLWGSAMPSWQEISERDRMAVIHYLKTFSARWEEEAVSEEVAVTPEPAITREAITRGETLFTGKATCFACHGATAQGDGALAETLTDVWGHPLRPADLTVPAGVSGGVKLGHDSEHLFRTILTGVGGTPMPPFQGQLSSDEIWDIVHYVQSLRVTAHARELIAAGLAGEDREDALSRIWASLSGAAGRGRLDAGVIEQTLAQLEAGVRVAENRESANLLKHQ